MGNLSTLRNLRAERDVRAFACLVVLCCAACVTAVSVYRPVSAQSTGGAAEAADVAAAWAALDAYQYGASREFQAVLTQFLQGSCANPAVRAEAGARLAGVLEGSAPVEAKRFACELLGLYGGAEAVPVLARLLEDPEFFEMARCALERLPCREADELLLGALEKAPEDDQAALINSLGERRCVEAVPALSGLVTAGTPEKTKAVLAALGKIPSREAREALLRMGPGLPTGIVDDYARALLQHADHAKADNKAGALLLFETVLALPVRDAVRLAAVKGRMELLDDEARRDAIAEALRGEDPMQREAGQGLARGEPAPELTEILVEQLYAAAPADQLRLLSVVETRKDVAAQSAILPLLKSTDEEVRRAAIHVLGEIGTAACVAPLAQMAVASPPSKLSRLAHEALCALTAPEADAAILDLARTREPAIRIEMIRCMVGRDTRAAVPDLLAMAAESTLPVELRAEAWRALETLAGAPDLPALVNAMVATDSLTVRRAAERALVSLARNLNAPDRSVPIVNALRSVTDTDVLCSLYIVLGEIGDDACLAQLRTAVQRGNPEVRETAVRALAQSSNPAVMDELLAVAEAAPGERMSVLAIRGVARLLRLPSEDSDEAQLARFRRALAAAPQAEERRMILSALADFPVTEAVRAAGACLQDPEVRGEAALAVNKILSALCMLDASDNAEDAALALDLDPATRWWTVRGQEEGMWLSIDFGTQCELSGLVLDNTSKPSEYPRHYLVFVSQDGLEWGAPVATGDGAEGKTPVTWNPVTAQYLKIQLAPGSGNACWSVYEIRFADPDTGLLRLRPAAQPEA